MNHLHNNKSMEDILRDTKHNFKAQQVFLKLLGKQKKSRNPFDEMRSYTLPVTKEIKPGADDV